MKAARTSSRLRTVGRVLLALTLAALASVLYLRHRAFADQQTAHAAQSLQTPEALAYATWLATLFSLLSLMCEGLGVSDQRALNRRAEDERRAARERFLGSFDAHSCTIEADGRTHHFVWDGDVASIPDRVAARPAPEVLTKLLAGIEYLDGVPRTARWGPQRAPNVAVIYETDASRNWKSAVYEPAYNQFLAVVSRTGHPRPRCPNCGALYSYGQRQCEYCKQAL
jgi:hypothetical protein